MRTKETSIAILIALPTERWPTNWPVLREFTLKERVKDQFTQIYLSKLF